MGKLKLLGLWVALSLLILLPEALSLETDKLSYREGEIIRVNERVSYCGSVGNSFVARLDCNRLVSSSDEKLVYVSDGKTVGTFLNLSIFGFFNIFLIKVVKRCFNSFV